MVRIAAADHELSTVAKVIRGRDGTIWISQPQDGNIIHFAANARRLGVVGRKGEGPGEFQAVGGMQDTDRGLVVFDPMLRRVTTFAASGRVAATRALTRPAALPPAAFVVAGDAKQAVYIHYPTPPSTATQGAGKFRSVPVFLASLGGESLSTLVVSDGRFCSLQVQRGNGVVGAGIPYCHADRWGVSSNLKYHAIATPTPVASGSTGFELLVVSSRGDTVTRSRHLLGPSPIPGRVRDSVIDALPARSREPGLAAEMIRGGLIPHTYPPVTEVAVSDDGDVWVTTRSGPTGSKGALVVLRGGRELGYTPLPRTSWVRWVGQSEGLIVEEDADGLQDVVLYRARARK
ncbi:MAG: hypothetical protein H0W15_08305 [Gemmatimonadales bacterium]|nr:hypothetical protein [Gemmatimonadales bacterium]